MNRRVIVATLMLCVLAAGIAEAGELQSGSATMGDVDPSRSLSVIHAEIHAALCVEAATRRMGVNTPQVLHLIDLYRELAAHPKRDMSVTMQRAGQRLRTRLQQVGKHIERQVAVRDRLARKDRIPPHVALPENHVLAQQVAVPPGALGQGAGPAMPPTAAGRPTDYGPELVALIQQTISPATWDINGGNGAVVYYAPLRVLVVSAPGEVHERVGGVLGQLRAAQ